MNPELERLADLVRLETGIQVKRHQEHALLGALGRAAPGLSPAGFLARIVLDGDDGLRDRLLDEVAVKETSFLRDAGQLATIDWRGLHTSALKTGDGTVRVWSAGCATGEETYTLALLACSAFGSETPPVHVVGTDFSATALAAAAAGRYRERALREVDRERRERWFSREGDAWLVGPSLRTLASFERHNLVRDPIPPPGRPRFDLVVCRNVLIYFELATVERVLASLEHALRPGGRLLLGAADALCSNAAAAPVPRLPARRERRALTRRPQREQLLRAALDAADRGSRDQAIAHATTLLADNPLDAEAYFLRGLVELESGEPDAAVASLRRALSIDPSFGLASFTLGRALDARGEDSAARRAYEQTLLTLAADDERHELLLQQVDLGDIAAACTARLTTIGARA